MSNKFKIHHRIEFKNEKIDDIHLFKNDDKQNYEDLIYHEYGITIKYKNENSIFIPYSSIELIETRNEYYRID